MYQLACTHMLTDELEPTLLFTHIHIHRTKSVYYHTSVNILMRY